MTEMADREYSWGHGRRFNAYSNYFKSLFGGRVQKVSIDAGFTCPNRDGKLGTGGCTFCNNDAFNPSYCVPEKSVSQQIQEGINFHKKRYRRSVGYLAYFQAYTNTYADIDHLEALYMEALTVPEVLGLIIGTRPDSINDKVLDLIERIGRSHYVALEYGVESVYDRTLLRVNRGHDFCRSKEAIIATAKRGIHCGAHFIFGLPGESRKDMLEMAELISALPLDTVKFHQLQIIKETIMENEYKNSPEDFELFSWEEYKEFFVKFLERLNPAFVVERFTSEAPPRLLSSPRWGLKRSEGLIVEFENRLEELDTWQGRLYKG
jgi:radical SAM protein (TIGR01212 family)